MKSSERRLAFLALTVVAINMPSLPSATMRMLKMRGKH